MNTCQILKSRDQVHSLLCPNWDHLMHHHMIDFEIIVWLNGLIWATTTTRAKFRFQSMQPKPTGQSQDILAFTESMTENSEMGLGCVCVRGSDLYTMWPGWWGCLCSGQPAIMEYIQHEGPRRSEDLKPASSALACWLRYLWGPIASQKWVDILTVCCTAMYFVQR